MRGASLQKTTAISFILHLTLFLFFFLVFRQSGHMVIPDHYTVNLVNSNVLPRADRTDNEAGERKRETPQQKESAAPSESRRKDVKADRKEDAKERESIEKKISLMAAKKRVQTQVGARKIISLKAGREKLARTAKGSSAKAVFSKAVSSPAATKGTAQPDDYYARVIDEIRQQWVWSSVDSGRRNIEAIVSIRILRDGTAIIQRWEKKSGDSLFDKSALRALAKASPLSPPPYEMEIGVRFYP
jgi:colicin import membrane protein